MDKPFINEHGEIVLPKRPMTDEQREFLDSLECLYPTCAECPYSLPDGTCSGDLPLDDEITKSHQFLVQCWGTDNVRRVIDAINTQDAKAMTFDEFLSHCIACGGNWGGMLLTGIKELYPAVWDAIPDDMGATTTAWGCLCTILFLLKVAV